MTAMKEVQVGKFGFDAAMDLTGFGKYNMAMMVTCCLLIMAMFMDLYGLSVAMPSVACEMQLSTFQQGLLSALPLIGVMLFSYAWGLSADTLGRRATLLLAMPAGSAFGLLASMAPTYAAFAVLKFLSAACSCSSNAAGFVLLGESVPSRFRGRFMFVMSTTTLISQLILTLPALPILGMSFRIPISWLDLEYRPWRLFVQLICLPGILGSIFILFLKESPKFLLCKHKEGECLDVLRLIYSWNTGMKKEDFPVSTVTLDQEIQNKSEEKGILHKIWNQTAPLFKPPLLRNNLILFYLLLCANMTSTGFTMWVPTISNAFFTEEDTSGKSFCELASQSASNNSTTDCDNVLNQLALYTTMAYSGASGLFSIVLGLVVGFLGKKTTTVMVFSMSVVCGILIMFIRIPMLSMVLFCIFLYVAILLANINTYLQENNPTYLRSMATCLSVVIARGFGFVSVQLIASLIGNHCTPMMIGYVALVASGLVVSIFLPSDKKEKETLAVSCEVIVASRKNSESNDIRL